MNRVIDVLRRFDRKTILLVSVALLLFLNLFRLAAGYYNDQKAEVETQQALLAQYQATAAKLPELKKQVGRLERRAGLLEDYLFTGTSVDEISSAMQIMLQKMVTDAGLDPESIRPIVQGKKGESGKYESIEIKIRLAGTMPQLVDFLGRFYKNKKLFVVDSFTVKPYKKTELKVFFDIKGFYSIKTAG
ncbi:MAG: type 4a pilus biogenesis protein PilO [Desulfobulbaceae bacterium]|uniref:Type 4a pilus biogenesis protein PilO n=1 Tax=Candidatus Desulfobia pelagia TaxID=2841692 RepID=A0A8J6TF35_9BACT|nr:type 4a pilus biogenesis protein PilO [Candidatus Desulfobia pelagia]